MVVSSKKGRGVTSFPPLPLLVAALAAAIGITFALGYAWRLSFHENSDEGSDDRPGDGGGDNDGNNNDHGVIAGDRGSGAAVGNNDDDNGYDVPSGTRKDRSESDATPRTANVTRRDPSISTQELGALHRETPPLPIEAASASRDDAVYPAGELAQDPPLSSLSAGVAAALATPGAAGEEASAISATKAKPVREHTTTTDSAATLNLPPGVHGVDKPEPSLAPKIKTKRGEKEEEKKMPPKHTAVVQAQVQAEEERKDQRERKTSIQKKKDKKKRRRLKLISAESATNEEGDCVDQGEGDLGLGIILTSAASATSTHEAWEGQDQGKDQSRFAEIATTAAPAASTTDAPTQSLHTPTTTALTATVPTSSKRRGGGSAAASYLRSLRVDDDTDEPEPPKDLAFNTLSTFWKQKESRHSFVQPEDTINMSHSVSNISLSSNEESAISKETTDSGLRKGSRGHLTSTKGGQVKEGDTVRSTEKQGIITERAFTSVAAKVKPADGAETPEISNQVPKRENDKPKDGSVDDSRLILRASSEDSSSRSTSGSSKESLGYVKIVRTPAGEAMSESEFLSQPLVVVDSGATSETTGEQGGEVVFAPPSGETASVVNDAAATAAGGLPADNSDKTK